MCHRAIHLYFVIVDYFLELYGIRDARYRFEKHIKRLRADQVFPVVGGGNGLKDHPGANGFLEEVGIFLMEALEKKLDGLPYRIFSRILGQGPGPDK